MPHQINDIIAQHYQILSILGQGEIGVTYLAQELESDLKVAIKAICLQQLTDWKQMELFEREAQVLKTLNHPQIPRYIDYFTLDTDTNKTFYLVQEYVQGKSLSTLVEVGWRNSEKELKKIAEQILNILIYLHQLTPPIIHRDIKPENLILDENEEIYLVDFGAVQNTYYTTLMKGSTVVGTYGYMAPEQFQGSSMPQSDLYGLGATLLYLLTHCPPDDLPEDNLKIDVAACTQVSKSLVAWLEKLLEPDFNDRFSSAKEALSALRYLPLIRTKKVVNRWLNPKFLMAIIIISLVVFGYKQNTWRILNGLGVAYPEYLCYKTEAMTNYLKTGGNPHILFTDSHTG